MTDLLIRIFIKDWQDSRNAKVREDYGTLAALIGIVSNLFLVALKVTIGVLVNSLAVIADGLNNLSDSVSSVVSLVSFKISNKPADRDHPFGHGRAEYVAALIVSFLILLVGYEITKQSISDILHPRVLEFSPVLVSFLVLSVLVKAWQMQANRKIGHRISSKTLLATSVDSRNDMLVTGGTIAGVVLSHAFRLNLDGYISLLIGLFILYSGYDLARDVISVLLGRSIRKEEADRIKEAVLAYEGILGVHDLISHAYGPTYSMVSLHAEVHEKVPIEVSHELIDRIEREVGEQLGIFLVIHMDPVTVDDARLELLKEKVWSLLEAFDGGRISAHDFRLVNGEDRINFIFDLELPFDYHDDEKPVIEKALKEGIREIDPRYQVVINMEYSFIEE